MPLVMTARHSDGVLDEVCKAVSVLLSLRPKQCLSQFIFPLYLRRERHLFNALAQTEKKRKITVVVVRFKATMFFSSVPDHCAGVHSEECFTINEEKWNLKPECSIESVFA